MQFINLSLRFIHFHLFSIEKIKFNLFILNQQSFFLSFENYLINPL